MTHNILEYLIVGLIILALTLESMGRKTRAKQALQKAREYVLPMRNMDAADLVAHTGHLERKLKWMKFFKWFTYFAIGVNLFVLFAIFAGFR